MLTALAGQANKFAVLANLKTGTSALHAPKWAGSDAIGAATGTEAAALREALQFRLTATPGLWTANQQSNDDWKAKATELNELLCQTTTKVSAIDPAQHNVSHPVG